jgi:hypothetical protein
MAACGQKLLATDTLPQVLDPVDVIALLCGLPVRGTGPRETRLEACGVGRCSQRVGRFSRLIHNSTMKVPDQIRSPAGGGFRRLFGHTTPTLKLRAMKCLGRPLYEPPGLTGLDGRKSGRGRHVSALLSTRRTDCITFFFAKVRVAGSNPVVRSNRALRE